jgi:hypothetical protein
LVRRAAGKSITRERGKEYNDVVRDYLDALARQRRDAFKLTTAVGQRLLP